MKQEIVSLVAFLSTTFNSCPTYLSPVAGNLLAEKPAAVQVLAQQSLKLTNRDDSQFVNQVFVDNILLALAYLKGRQAGRQVDWNQIRQPTTISFILNPGEVFAFHNNVLPEFKDQVVKTMNSSFVADEGYRSSGFMVGDGVCHLASLINWTATEAGLKVMAKVDHNFRLIPDIPKQYGTSIRYSQTGNNSQNQNLYLTNNFDYRIEFKFKAEKDSLTLQIIKRD